MNESEELRHFVRDILGCECPDAVLSQMRVLREPAEIAGIPLDLCLDVGGRLLVWVTTAEPSKSIDAALDSVFAAGKGMRDTGGFNRFRFVVGASDPTAIREELSATFSRLPAIDERLHLHVVDVADVPAPTPETKDGRD